MAVPAEAAARGMGMEALRRPSGRGFQPPACRNLHRAPAPAAAKCDYVNCTEEWKSVCRSTSGPGTANAPRVRSRRHCLVPQLRESMATTPNDPHAKAMEREVNRLLAQLSYSG